MATTIQLVNMAVSESAANTYVNAKTEISGSVGAKKCVLIGGTVDGDEPNKVASTLTETRIALLVGDKTDRTSISQMGIVGSIIRMDETILCDGSAVVLVHNTHSPHTFKRAVEIPKTSDGKFYITGEVAGSNNTGAVGLKASLDILIER